MKEVILIPDGIKDNQLKQLQTIAKESEFLIYDHPRDIKQEDLEKTTIIFGNMPVEKIKQAKQVKWIQTKSAGVDQYCNPGVLQANTCLTNATGAYGKPISEYMVGTVFALYKNLLKYKMRQSKAVWANVGHVKMIDNTKVLVIGLGDIGLQFALRMKKLGAYTIGIKRTLINKPEGIDELYTMEHLDEVLPQADVIALALPRTSSTYHMLEKRRFELMKDDALIINVGRGEAIDTEALVETLQSGKLLGAALDVFEQEPLDPNHPLWQMENVLITPHVSGGNYDLETGDMVFDIMLDNFKRYFNHEPLHNIVDKTTGYKKSNS